MIHWIIAITRFSTGTVVCFGGKNEITQSTDLYDSKVAGVISTNPAHLMNAQAGTNETHPAVALTGRVPCKVMGTIRKGDLMVTSAQPGVAMSAETTASDAAISVLVNFINLCPLANLCEN